MFLDEQKIFSFLPFPHNVARTSLESVSAGLGTQLARLQTGWAWRWGRETSRVIFSSFSFYFPLVLEALRVTHLVIKVTLRTIKIRKVQRNEELLFMYMPFMYSLLIFQLLMVLQKYLKMECSHEHRCKY